MTKLLEKAFKQASNLPDMEQNILARWILDDFNAEKKWNHAFAETEDILGQFAGEVIEEHNQGQTTPLNIDLL